jgi:Putative polyhydroxyalkanoic acid system protein (PHA_gran_rgn)
MPSYSRQVSIPGKTSQELFEQVAHDIDRFMSKVSIGKYEIEKNPTRKEVSIKSSMVSATLICREEQVTLDAKLSLLAAPFRSKLDESIDRWLAKTFNLSRST